MTPRPAFPVAPRLRRMGAGFLAFGLRYLRGNVDTYGPAQNTSGKLSPAETVHLQCARLRLIEDLKRLRAAHKATCSTSAELKRITSTLLRQ